MSNNDLNLTPTDRDTLGAALMAIPEVKLVSTSFHTLGNSPSIGVSVYYNTKEECASLILDNGKHFKAMIHGDGSLVYLTGYKMTKKLRQGKMKNLGAAVERLVKHATEA